MKQASFFDQNPLARSFLSASPFLRKDSVWSEVVNPSETSPSSAEMSFGILPNCLLLPSDSKSEANLHSLGTKNLQDLVREEFRQNVEGFDINRCFAISRRMDKVKGLHSQITNEEAPKLSPLTPSPLEKLSTTSNQPPVVGSVRPRNSTSAIKTGSMLLAHPVLVDDFTQAAVLVTSVVEDEGVTGLTMNVPYVPLELVLKNQRSHKALKERYPELWSRKIRSANVKYFCDWTVYSGGSLGCAPLLVHKSSEISAAVEKLNTKTNKSKSKSAAASTEAHSVALPGGWFIHALSDVMMVEPTLVKKNVQEDANARIVMNYSGWTEEDLVEEVAQQWWIPVEAKSACRALPSLLAPCIPTPSNNVIEADTSKSLETSQRQVPHLVHGAPSNYMWQRAVASLGSEFQDFARLKIIEKNPGEDASTANPLQDYRALITDTFQDDLPEEDVIEMPGDHEEPYTAADEAGDE